MEFKVENLCGFLIRSKLMTPDEMLAMRQRWTAEAKDPTQVPQFLKWLVGKNYVTEYQASLLSRGHVDDFFLGDYKVLERIGRGRMAGVYKAVHPSGQTVAIKVLPPSRAKNGQMLGRFQREARLAVKLRHPHVVRAFQLGQIKGVHYLVMEYLDGEPLDEVLARRKRLTPAEAVRLMHQALLGLQHIHERGMVHRDLKPANLMLFPAPARGERETTLNGNVKILDIGLARELFDENTPADQVARDDLTGEGVLLGTPDYLAPEQARDPRSIDIRADIYSLGCTLYHLLTGQPPFPDKNILNQMIRHATETPKPIAEFVPNLPDGLASIVDWMMAKQAGQRYPTPARAAQALEAFMLVTAPEAPAKAEESLAMKKYLTWLESAEKQDQETTIQPPGEAAIPPSAKPGSNPGAAPVVSKPGSNPGVAKAAPAPAADSAKSGVKRKRRTGVKMPETASTGTNPTQPIPAAPPTAPVAAPIAAGPAPIGPPADQVDVELVDASAAPPPKKGLQFGKKEIILGAVGLGTLLLLACGCGIGLTISFTK